MKPKSYFTPMSFSFFLEKMVFCKISMLKTRLLAFDLYLGVSRTYYLFSTGRFVVTVKVLTNGGFQANCMITVINYRIPMFFRF